MYSYLDVYRLARIICRISLSERAAKAVEMHRLIQVMAALQCDKYQNLVCRLIGFRTYPGSEFVVANTTLAKWTKLEPNETRDFQQCGILTSVDSGEPLQPPFKLRNSK